MLSDLVINIFSVILLAAVIGCAGQPGGQSNGNDNGDENLASVAVLVTESFSVAHREGDTAGEQEVDICDGWFPIQANHVLTIETGLNMAVRVISTDDVRLWILCGQSNFCGERAAEDTWEVSRFWGAAVCSVYIGAAAQGSQLAYALEFDAL